MPKIEAMMDFEKMVLGQPSWLWSSLVAAGLIMLIVFWSYRRVPLAPRPKAMAIFLKSLAIALALFCLLDPLWIRSRPKSQANWVGILVDDSQSMQAVIGEPDKPLQREATIDDTWRARLASEASWQEKLSDDFRLRRYRFGGRLESVEDFSDLNLAEMQSWLVRSIRLFAERMKDRPVAGLVVVSDGQSTDPADGDWDFSQLPFPVYPVLVEGGTTERDLQISDLTVRQSDFEAAPVTIMATLQHRGFAGRSAHLELLDTQGKPVQSQKVLLESEATTQPVEFRFRPEESGVQGYQVKATLVSESRPIDSIAGRRDQELTLINNQRSLVVDRGHGPYRILYVSGRPNWEHKFLRRALQEDAEIQLTSLVRIAKKEPRFSFRDSRVESANPLFAGFEDVTEGEKEQYNEPVFARLGVTDASQLKGGFPKTAEEMFAYQAVILDDIEHDFFTADQQALLRQFVSFRGGGLLYLGGQESMRGKGFRESVLGQLLPIYGEDRARLDAKASASNVNPVVRYELSREGWLQPFLRTAETEEQERQRLQRMPSLRVLNEAGGLKPGAVVLAEARSLSVGSQGQTEGSVAPALVAQRFGKGRSAALLVGDLWRWGMHHQESGPAPLFQAWRQIVRWLISDVPRGVNLRVQTALESAGGQTARLMVEVLSAEFESKDDVVVTMEVTRPDGSTYSALAEPSANQSGVFELPLITPMEGVYKAKATVANLDGSHFGGAAVGWVHEPSVSELQRLGANPSFLEDLARQTGGAVLQADELNALRDHLLSGPVPVTEKQLTPLWHHPWVLFVALSLLCGEWWIRRRNGLP